MGAYACLCIEHCSSAAPKPLASLYDQPAVAFNETFKKMGIPHEWDVETYGRLLATGGGKERMTKFFQECSNEEPFKSITDPEEQQELVKKLHKMKTETFQKMIENSQMPLRTGVEQFVGA